MDLISIPAWNPLGVLPPIDEKRPTSPSRSPYRVSLKDIVQRFSTSKERCAIIYGFLDYRAALHAAGMTEGFQWLDGSFTEQVEVTERRTPNDIDVVTFVAGEVAIDDEHALLDQPAVKRTYKVDGYFVELDTTPPAELASLSAYWYSMWSHRRNQSWKGFLEIDLAPHDDADALACLTGLNEQGDRE